MAQALLAEGDGSTGDQHHLSALILQHGDLAGKTNMHESWCLGLLRPKQGRHE